MRALVSSLPTAQEVARQQQLYRVCVERTVLFYCVIIYASSLLLEYIVLTSYEFECTRVHQIITEASSPSSMRAKLIGTASTSCCAVCEFEILFLDVSAPRACMRASQNQLRADSQISHSAAGDLNALTWQPHFHSLRLNFPSLVYFGLNVLIRSNVKLGFNQSCSNVKGLENCVGIPSVNGTVKM
jgi:hypothetical protein